MPAARERPFRIGCSAWNYKAWNYSERELEEWARRFEHWSREVEILAYFNNDWEVFAVRNALWLERRLSLSPSAGR